MLKEKKIVLGITGSIAAYKSCLIIRQLIKQGAEVQVVITPSGKEFITPITLSALTQKPVISDFFSQRDGTWHSHVDLGLWADAMLIAPCTAATLGKMCHGIADNMLVTTYLSMKAPVFVAPAMDLDMYKHSATQENIEILKGRGNHIIEAANGFLASGLEGKGRMEEPEAIVARLEQYFNNETDEKHDLNGKHILITAGPTYEKIDPVRFIGNYSSGKMGFALAEECSRRGASVTLVAGPVHITCPEGINRIEDNLHIELQPTHDIAATLGRQKTNRQRIVAFALETNNEEANALAKLTRKNADFIVLNSTRNTGTTFQSDDNQITIISKGEKKEYEKKCKRLVAHDIINELVSIL